MCRFNVYEMDTKTLCAVFYLEFPLLVILTTPLYYILIDVLAETCMLYTFRFEFDAKKLNLKFSFPIGLFSK